MKTVRSWNDDHFAGLLNRGIAAAKAGDRVEAQNFLRAAIKVKPLDPAPWLWLSSTTDDRDEQRDYLEEALAIDPSNMAARRGLAQLKGLVAGQEKRAPRPVAHADGTAAIEARARMFSCPNCGGRVRYDARAGEGRCERCGTARSLRPASASSDRHEKALDFVLPTSTAQRRATSAHAVTCSHCGAGEILPAGQLTAECAFCGSDQLISSPEIAGLLTPEGIIPMQIGAKEAGDRLHEWLGQGFFTPRALQRQASQIKLRPAYYPVWSFDAAFTARWIATVENGDRRERREGEKILFFDDLLVPGTSKLPLAALREVEPFDIGALAVYHEDMLAGWPALVYEHSLADASIVARGEMARFAQAELQDRVLIDKEVHDFKVIPTGHIDQTYRQILLPLWTGHYSFEGKEYPIYINGQSGKVGGEKPRDSVKVAIATGAGVLLCLTALLVVLQLLL